MKLLLIVAVGLAGCVNADREPKAVDNAVIRYTDRLGESVRKAEETKAIANQALVERQAQLGRIGE